MADNNNNNTMNDVDDSTFPNETEYANCLNSYKATLDYVIRHFEEWKKLSIERIEGLEEENQLLREQNQQLLNSYKSSKDITSLLQMQQLKDQQKIAIASEALSDFASILN